MDLINKADMQVWTPFASATNDGVYVAELRQVQDSLGAYISDEMVTAILALTRDESTSTELYQYWLNYVRPYVVHSVFLGLVSTHGFNAANQGFTTFSDGQNTARAVSPQERSQLIRKWTTPRESWLSRMLREFSDQNGTFDSVVYEVNTDDYDTENRKMPAMNVIGGVNKFLPYNRKFRL